MQVSALLIDELLLDGEPVAPVAAPLLYSFDSPALVSARRIDNQPQVGPIGVLKGGHAEVTQFPTRPLSWTGPPGREFSYKEPWTAPPWTLYVLLPPVEFIGFNLALRCQGLPEARFEVASFADRLFYFALLGHARDQHAFSVEARLVHDVEAVQRTLGSVETVAGRRKWTAFQESVSGPLASAAALVRLAAAARALFGL
jgi:hypothetical protein